MLDSFEGTDQITVSFIDGIFNVFDNVSGTADYVRAFLLTSDVIIEVTQ